jgi:hypothetical protein
VRGIWNERLGWFLLLVGLSAAVGFDPWSLSEESPAALPGSLRLAVWIAQAALLMAGFLQIGVALLLREDSLPSGLRQSASVLLVMGTLLYTAGYAGALLWPRLAWLIPTGAVINLLGFALIAWSAWRADAAPELRVVPVILLLGMAIEVVHGLYIIDAARFLAIDLGKEDGVRLRMLRLAAVAATALPLLTLLYRNLTSDSPVSWNRWGCRAMLVGAIGMPMVLAAACFIDVNLKYLLPIPALAMTGGVILALLLARRTASSLEQAGWLLVAVSMTIGLFIGLYAFDGPLPAPAFVGGYNEFVRRLSRLGHAYCIVFGLLAILLARQSAGQLAGVLLLAGSALSELAIVLLGFLPVAPAILAPGPALVGLALLAGVCRPVKSCPMRDDILKKVPKTL